MKDLDHPCMNACSGWKQGFESGAKEAAELRAQLESVTQQWRAGLTVTGMMDKEVTQLSAKLDSAERAYEKLMAQLESARAMLRDADTQLTQARVPSDEPLPDTTELLDILRRIAKYGPPQGEKHAGTACAFCDMGGAGYATRGDGFHDDECAVKDAQVYLVRTEKVSRIHEDLPPFIEALKTTPLKNSDNT